MCKRSSWMGLIMILLLGIFPVPAMAAGDEEAAGEIFETSEFSFTVPASWEGNYLVNSFGNSQAYYYSFVNRHISYKSESDLIYIVSAAEKDSFEKKEGYEFSEAADGTIYGRTIYIGIYNPTLEPQEEDEQYKEEYQQMLKDSADIASSLQLVTEHSQTIMEIDDYTFEIPKSWEGNVELETYGSGDYVSYVFYQIKARECGGQLLYLGSCKYGYKPSDLDGVTILASDEETGKNYYMGSATGVTWPRDDEEINAEHWKLFNDRETIVMTFRKKDATDI